MTTTTVTRPQELDAVELDALPRSTQYEESIHDSLGTHSSNAGGSRFNALPPTDRGKGAYTTLACCTLAQAPIWGGCPLSLQTQAELTAFRLFDFLWNFPGILHLTRKS
jgi:hypothetical protein